MRCRIKGRSGQTLSAVGFSALVALAGTKQERWVLICPASDEDVKRREWQQWETAEPAPPYPETILELVLGHGMSRAPLSWRGAAAITARGKEMCHWECAGLLFVLTV